jgi:hypothetical protein
VGITMAFRRRIARQPIGHDGARHHAPSLQEFPKEAPRGECAAATLHKDVKHLAGTIDGPPKPDALATDHQTEFIEVRDVRT